MVYIWYFCGFVIDQSVIGLFIVFVDFGDNVGGDVYIEFVGGIVIEEKQGFSVGD